MMYLSDYSKILGLDSNSLYVFKHNYKLKGLTDKAVFERYVAMIDEQNKIYNELQNIYYEITNFCRLGRFLIEKGFFKKENSAILSFEGVFLRPKKIIGDRFLNRRKQLLEYCKEFLEMENGR